MTPPTDDDKLHGLLVIDKPLTWSSMDVVRKVRYAAGKRSGRGKQKVGHAGTLDPLATGVLVLCFGRATKRVETLMGQRKIYETTIDLSAFTASDDAETARQPVEVTTPPTPQAIDEALHRQTGEVLQVPPDFSAVRRDGQRAYQAARRGQSLRLGPRQIRIDAIDRLAYDWPTLNLRVTCGRGTYIRSIARDLGKLLGTGGYLTSLRRTAVGDYTIEQAFDIERLERGLHQNDLLEHV
ncbi:MAG: tRNA pseudouridine(55) synthase TruB [Phycisphaeraceae bacterium]